MARSLHNKSNVVAPTSDYPYGRIKDKIAGVQAGTPVNEAVYGDIHQFFSRLMEQAGLEENEQPDNDYTGFQLYKALLKTIAKKVGQYSSDDDLTPTAATDLNSFIYPGIFNVEAYTLSHDPGLDGPGQLMVGGNPDVAIVQRLIDLNNGAEWKRTWSLASGFGGWVLIRLAQKLLDIGSFDLSASNAVKQVPHGLGIEQIRSVRVLIKSDLTGASRSSLDINYRETTIGDLTWGQGVYVNVTNVTIIVDNNGFYDSADFNSISVNRGHIIIEYDPSN
jgi:hypothetical protein